MWYSDVMKSQLMETCGIYLVFVLTTASQIFGQVVNDPRCQPVLELCPPGHFMTDCTGTDGADGVFCERCDDDTFQPDENRYYDRCRLRRICGHPYMEYKDFGSTIKDAECMCISTHHFESDDQRACVPNRVCGKGFGQGPYGACENCLNKNMYSNLNDRSQRCLPLKNCEQKDRCTVKKSNGTSDNECGPIVNDVENCDSFMKKLDGLSEGVIASIIIVVVVLFVAIIFVIYYFFCRTTPRDHDVEIAKETVDAAIFKTVEFSKKDKEFCNKVWRLCYRVIESRIGKQIWTLAQELFRSHSQTGKYEIIVEKYKEVSASEGVKGYLHEWCNWKGDTHDSLTLLFHSLRQIQREDIVIEICRRIKGEAGDIGIQIPGSGKTGRDNRALYFKSVLPCSKRETKKNDAIRNGYHSEKTLLSQGRANNEEEESEGTVSYRPQPSAPALEQDVPFGRQESVAVQASS